MKNLLPHAFILCCFCPKTESIDFGSRLRPFSAENESHDSTADSSKNAGQRMFIHILTGFSIV